MAFLSPLPPNLWIDPTHLIYNFVQFSVLTRIAHIWNSSSQCRDILTPPTYIVALGSCLVRQWGLLSAHWEQMKTWWTTSIHCFLSVSKWGVCHIPAFYFTACFHFDWCFGASGEELFHEILRWVMEFSFLAALQSNVLLLQPLSLGYLWIPYRDYKRAEQWIQKTKGMLTQYNSRTKCLWLIPSNGMTYILKVRILH